MNNKRLNWDGVILKIFKYIVFRLICSIEKIFIYLLILLKRSCIARWQKWHSKSNFINNIREIFFSIESSMHVTLLSSNKLRNSFRRKISILIGLGYTSWYVYMIQPYRSIKNNIITIRTEFFLTGLMLWLSRTPVEDSVH